MVDAAGAGCRGSAVKAAARAPLISKPGSCTSLCGLPPHSPTHTLPCPPWPQSWRERRLNVQGAGGVTARVYLQPGKPETQVSTQQVVWKAVQTYSCGQGLAAGQPRLSASHRAKRVCSD